MRFCAFAIVALGLLPGAALAETIVAKDGAGQTYQLNDDGTYGIVVKSEDGRTFILERDGTWHDPDIEATLEKRFVTMFDEAMKKSEGPKIEPSALPKYRDCLVAAFNQFPIGARKLFVSGPDVRANYEQMEKQYPDVAKSMNDTDRACRKDLPKVE